MYDSKKILIFQPTIGAYRIDLFNTLSKHFNLNIYIEYSQSDFEIYNPELSKNLLCKPNILKKNLKLINRQLYKGYWSAIKKSKPDIVLVSEFGFNAIASIIYRIFTKKRYKIISLCDDSFYMLSTGKNFSRIHKFIRGLITPFLDNLILVEPDACEWYKKRYHKGIYFPIVSDEIRMRREYTDSLNKSDEYIRQYQLEGKKIILYVGRLIEIKNVESLIHAFKKIYSHDTNLIIVGDGEQAQYLKEISSDNPNIIFTGRLHGQELYAWYNIAHILALPSIIEPFGAVTNESLVGGCKVLISNRAGSRCLVKDGINGYHINPSDINDIASKMEIMISNITTTCHLPTTLRESLMIEDYPSLTTNLISEISK